MNKRAKQFLPFDALKGFKEALRQKEKVIVKQSELSEDEAVQLSAKLQQIKKGSIIKIIYYHEDNYLTIEGMVSNINYDDRYLTIVKNKIRFECIYDIQADYFKDYDVY